MTGGWDVSDLPDQRGRTVVVTGASSGLGQATAAAFALAGAHVVLAVRDAARGERAAAGMTGSTEVRRLDLADLASVRAFAAAWEGPLDVLVNNAGVMAVPRGRTVDGFETQLGTNHLGHFALTNLLLRHIADRVVTVSSAAHRHGRIDLEDLNWQQRRYRRWAAYGQSKLANLLFTLELERRLVEAGSPVRALAAADREHRADVADGRDQPALRAERRDGCPADAVRRDPGPSGRQLRRSRRHGGEAWASDAGGAHGGGQRRRAREAALGQVGGPDRRAVRSAVATSATVRALGARLLLSMICAKLLVRER